MKNARRTRRRWLYLAALLAAATIASIVWREDTNGISTAAPLVCLAGFAVALAVAWTRHIDMTRLEDDLILEGDLSDPAVAGRAAALQDASRRESLAEDLRWQLKLAEQQGRQHTISTLSAAQRRVLISEREHLLAMADHIEAHESDPRALVLLSRITDDEPASALAAKLDQAWNALAREPLVEPRRDASLA